LFGSTSKLWKDCLWCHSETKILKQIFLLHTIKNDISSIPVMVGMATNIDTAIFVSEDSHDSYYMKHNFKNWSHLSISSCLVIPFSWHSKLKWVLKYTLYVQINIFWKTKDIINSSKSFGFKGSSWPLVGARDRKSPICKCCFRLKNMWIMNLWLMSRQKINENDQFWDLVLTPFLVIFVWLMSHKFMMHIFLKRINLNANKKIWVIIDMTHES